MHTMSQIISHSTIGEPKSVSKGEELKIYCENI